MTATAFIRVLYLAACFGCLLLPPVGQAEDRTPAEYRFAPFNVGPPVAAPASMWSEGSAANPSLYNYATTPAPDLAIAAPRPDAPISDDQFRFPGLDAGEGAPFLSRRIADVGVEPRGSSPPPARTHASSEAAFGADDPDWRVTVGIGVGVGAEYEGGNEYEAKPLPSVDIAYRDIARLNVREGLSIRLHKWRQISFGIGANYYFPRDADDADALTGLEDIDGGVAARIFAAYEARPFDAKLEIIQDVSGGHDGGLLKLEGGYGQPLWRNRILGRVGLSATAVTEAYADSYFGISAIEAARSRYAAYEAGAGIKDVGVSFSIRERFGERLGLVWQARFSRLLGDAADSPIVDEAGDPNQFFGGVILTYQLYGATRANAHAAANASQAAIK